jgi:hypothetical protein
VGVISISRKCAGALLLLIVTGRPLPGQTEGKYIQVSPGIHSTELRCDFRQIPYSLIREKDGTTTIVAAQCERSDEYGEPDLPFLQQVLYLPDNTNPDSLRLEILDCQWTHLGRGFTVRPVIPGYAGQEREKRPTYPSTRGEKNESIYSRDAPFPAEPLTTTRPFARDGKVAVLLTARPFRYNPVKGMLEIASALHARICHTTLEGGTLPQPLSFSPAVRWRGVEKGAALGHLSSDSGYVIIATKKTIDSSARLGDFAEFKRSQGYSVKIATEDDYGMLTGPPPDGTAERIRQWLIENYGPCKIRYALLIGNPAPVDVEGQWTPAGDVPMKMLYPRVGDSWYMGVHAAASDFYYADLTGNWDLDGDGLMGEWRSSLGPTSPDPRIDPETFSIRWTGLVEVRDTNWTRFAAFYDDGCRMWVDSQLVFDHWQDQMAGLRYVDIPQPGLHTVRIEYYQNRQNAFFRLFKGLAAGGWLIGVMGSELYYWDGASYVRGGLNGTYFNDKDLTDSVFSRIDPGSESGAFDFLWLSGDRGEGGVDFTPEISVGRIPLYGENYAELDSILSKTIRYESSTDTSWRRSALLAMRPFDQNTPNYTLGEQMKNDFLVPAGFSTFRMYNEEYGCVPVPEAVPCTEENMLSAWSQPFGLTVFVTHGSGDQALDVLRSDSCYRLDDAKPALVISGACNNGYPEQVNNLGMALLRSGAVATLTSSRISFYGIGLRTVEPDNRFSQGITYYLARDVSANRPVGDALDSVKSISADAANNFYWMNIFVTNLYGDPSLTLFGRSGGGTTGVFWADGNPGQYELSQNYPNPFNPSTTIRYCLPGRSDVSLSLYNTLGQLVATLVRGEQAAGYHEARFDASGLSSGVYFYRLRAGEFIGTRKLVVLH